MNLIILVSRKFRKMSENKKKIIFFNFYTKTLNSIEIWNNYSRFTCAYYIYEKKIWIT